MMLVLAIVEIFSVILQRIFCDSTLKKKKIRRYTDYLVWGGYFAVFKGSCDKNGNQDPYTTDRNDKYFQPILKIQFRFSVQFYNERGKFNNQIPDNFR